MIIAFWALSLTSLSWPTTVASPQSSALVNTTTDEPECPDECACTRDLRTVFCTGIDPYSTLQQLTNRFTETLTLEECWMPEETFNQTYSDLYLGYLTHISLKECPINSTSLVGGYHSAFPRLRILEISGFSVDQETLEAIDCDFLDHLRDIRIVNTSLDQNPLPNCDTNSLRSLNFSHNSLMKFDMQNLQYFYNLQTLDLSHNNLQLIKPSTQNLNLKSLKVSDNPELKAVCTKLLRSLPHLQRLDISRTGIFQIPLGLLEHRSIQTLDTVGVDFKCNCQTTLRLESLPNRELFENLECSFPVSGTKFLLTDKKILRSLDCGADLQQQPLSEYRYRAGDTVYLDCPLEGSLDGYEVLWLSPRHDLVRSVPEPQQVCQPAQNKYKLAPTTRDYSYWKDHYIVLSNGSLRIDLFGWRDRGAYTCFASNGIQNSSAKSYLRLNYHYRNKVYYLSLGWGFGSAACFLGLTLLGKLLHYLLWNYGCCLCCACCKGQQPPKIKKLAKVVDSIETYRIQQLEKLRENYNMQSQRIRDNCVMQMEKVRENYSGQVKAVKDIKTFGAVQVTGIKDQYSDQITKIRDYSSGQLDKCHENYIFQRQRLRKFSAQNYLRIRETKQYTQKTMNRVLENMPALYLDLSSCKQGIGDQDLREWQDEMDRREAEMREILDADRVLDLDGLGDSQSLYFTPTGTPYRDIVNDCKGTPVRDENGKIIYSPSRSPEKGAKHRGHKRMVSNLSSLFPFWWGVSQPQEVETVAIVEPLRQDDGDDTADTFLPDTSLNNGEEQSIPLITKDRRSVGDSDASNNSTDICPNSSVSNQNSPKTAAELLRHREHVAETTNPNLNRSCSLPTDLGDSATSYAPPPLPKIPPPKESKPFPVLADNTNKNLQLVKQHRSVEILSNPGQALDGGGIRHRSASLVQIPADAGFLPKSFIPGDPVNGVGGLDESITESSITDSGIKDCGDDDFGDMKGFLGPLDLQQQPVILQQGQSLECGVKDFMDLPSKADESIMLHPETPVQLEEISLNEIKVAEDKSKMADGETKMAVDKSKMAEDKTKMAEDITKMVVESLLLCDSKADDQATMVAAVTDDHEQVAECVGNGKATFADRKFVDDELTDVVAVTDENEI